MIEFIAGDLCTACGTCVEVCPTGVFAGAPGTVPRIAHPEACQTCFMCELYCRADAIFVGPDAGGVEGFDPATTRAAGLLGEMRRLHGWDEWAADPRYPNDHWRMETVFERARSVMNRGPAPQTGKEDRHAS
ncbi:4Fe-4S dicluster domain-containing protein [Paenirhodobacter populi]|uniref:Ferredoxin family protein n=1 Tax=Paenirhodobacter populi TaxID=2306993 RepID=A0A443IWU7_9RHOB|nr:ferredoxin family protein [Sinirhodobacter populi]RWR12653.1 ferredoxin family protein [Sinirhodobacter populi]